MDVHFALYRYCVFMSRYFDIACVGFFASCLLDFFVIQIITDKHFYCSINYKRVERLFSLVFKGIQTERNRRITFHQYIFHFFSTEGVYVFLIGNPRGPGHE